MGCRWAPLIAQESHERLLQSFGALNCNEHLKFGEVLPRADDGHFSGVCVDDRVDMQFVPKKSLDIPCRDTMACTRADHAYASVGLIYHPKKRVRRATIFQAWGAEVEGVGAKRSTPFLCHGPVCEVSGPIAALIGSLVGLLGFCVSILETIVFHCSSAVSCHLS